MDLPTNANYVRYVNLNTSSAVTNWAMLNLKSNLPNASYIRQDAADGRRGQFPVPPVRIGVRRASQQQVVVLSDFGPGFDNASYQATTIGDVQLRLINSIYGFSTTATRWSAGARNTWRPSSTS